MAMFLTFSLRDAKAGINLARLALELNPACSADLWCTLGDGLFEFGRVAEAKSAYERALEVNESDTEADSRGKGEDARGIRRGVRAQSKTGPKRGIPICVSSDHEYRESLASWPLSQHATSCA